jgi:tetratricopeptide (TPR) repeat protein
MTDSTPKYQLQFDKSILGALGDYSQVTQNIHLEPGQPSPYMLPQQIQDFTGRVDYIAKIEEILARGKIATIAGIPGVGKSALAIRVAHQLKDRYPDAQLYANLHGQTPESALETKTVLIRFLTALTGRDESQLATDLDGLVAQYRSTLANKRALVILDNARDEAQIRDLLPSNPDCAVVVTSRFRLMGLPGAVLIDLEPMLMGIDQELGEAELLFQAILQDGKRVEAELPAAREIVKLCGGLPIAIRITAATLNQKIWAKRSLQTYAQELDTELRLDKLKNANVEKAFPGQGSVRASFNLSYKLLAEEDQQLFCWAGSLPGVSFGVAVLASVMNWEESEIESGLNRLLEAQVLELRGDDRFGWHDLMRLFAKEQSKNSERKTILGLGLTWYCKQVKFWGDVLDSVRCRQLTQQLALKTEKTSDEWERDLSIMALNWFATEQDNWVDIVKDLTQIPRPSDAVNLAANLVPFFNLRGIWGDWVVTHRMVKVCAKEAGDLPGLAQTLDNLGNVYQCQRKWDQAINHYEDSLVISHELGDNNGIAQTLDNLGTAYQSHGKSVKAIDCYEKSIAISLRLRDDSKIAKTLGNLGSLYQSQDQWAMAIDCYEKFLQVSRRLGDKQGVAKTLGNLGNLYQNQGNLFRAIDCYQKFLEISRGVEDEYRVAQTLDNLGSLYQSQDKWVMAIDCYKEFLEISHRLGDKQGVAQTLSNLGNVYQNQGDMYGSHGNWGGAIDRYEKSLEIFRQLGSENEVVQTLNNLGSVYQSQGDMYKSQHNWDGAIDRYKKSLEIFHQLGSDQKIAQAVGNLGNVYRSQGDMYESQGNLGGAIDQYEKSLEIFHQLGSENEVGKTLNNLGNVYRSQNKCDKAINCYEKSLEIFHQLGDNHFVGKTLMNLGLAYNQGNQTEKANKKWREALSFLNHGSYEVLTVLQWLPRRRKHRKVNYFPLLAILAISSLTFFSILYGIWPFVIYGFGIILLFFIDR